MPVSAAFIVSKKWNLCKKGGCCRPRFVSVACSLKRSGNYGSWLV